MVDVYIVTEVKSNRIFMIRSLIEIVIKFSGNQLSFEYIFIQYESLLIFAEFRV